MTRAGSRRLRILVAGAGAFGREHLDRLTARNDVQVIGVADPSPAARALVNERYGIDRCEESPQMLLHQVEADGIIVATPAAIHVDIALQALERGVGVLLEKPVAPNAELATGLAEAAARSRARLLPGHVLRFSRDHQALVEIVRSGRIGRINYVNSRRYRDEDHALRYSDIDPIMMTMIHDIDLALWVAQSSFQTARARRSDGGGFRSMTIANAVTDSGVSCDLRTTWTFAGGELPPDRLEVVGEAGSVELDAGQSLRLYADGQKTEIPLVAGDDPLANEIDHFLACVRDPGKPLELKVEDARTGLKLADALMDSLSLDREVSVQQ